MSEALRAVAVVLKQDTATGVELCMRTLERTCPPASQPGQREPALSLFAVNPW